MASENRELENGDRHGRRAELKRFLDGREIPAGEQGLAELRRLVNLFLGEVAVRAAPIINHLAGSKPATTFAEKKELAKWINAQALELGLAVRCPKTGKPGYFVGNGSHNLETGRFQLVLCEDASQRTVTAVQLPEFKLVPRKDGVFPAKSWMRRCEDAGKKSGRHR